MKERDQSNTQSIKGSPTIGQQKGLKITMRNRIRKHCNAINAKGGEVNNKFKHSLKTNRPEALSDHAQVSLHNRGYQGGAEMWSIDNILRKNTLLRSFSSKEILFIVLTCFIHCETRLLGA